MLRCSSVLYIASKRVFYRKKVKNSFQSAKSKRLILEQRGGRMIRFPHSSEQRRFVSPLICHEVDESFPLVFFPFPNASLYRFVDRIVVNWRVFTIRGTEYMFIWYRLARMNGWMERAILFHRYSIFTNRIENLTADFPVQLEFKIDWAAAKERLTIELDRYLSRASVFRIVLLKT